MISTEINNASDVLKALLGQVAPEQAEVIRLVRRNLLNAAEQVLEMETSWPCPKTQETIPLPAHWPGV